MTLFLNVSPARRQFKDLLGQANHLLVTVLVGLHAVEVGLITDCPKELHAAWNPKDPKASAARSRKLVLEMALIRATDAIDAYISWACRKPAIVRDDATMRNIHRAERSVLNRFRALADNSKILDKKMFALVEVLIAWRNLSAHALADNEASEASLQILQDNDKWLRENFRGLSAERLISDFRKHGPPSLKDTTSLIQAAHQATEQLDQELLAKIDPEEYLWDFIEVCSKQRDGTGNKNTSQAKIIQSVWGKDESDREATVMSFLTNNGLSRSRKDGQVLEFTEGLLTSVATMKPTQVLNELKLRLNLHS